MTYNDRLECLLKYGVNVPISVNETMPHTHTPSEWLAVRLSGGHYGRAQYFGGNSWHTDIIYPEGSIITHWWYEVRNPKQAELEMKNYMVRKITTYGL